MDLLEAPVWWENSEAVVFTAEYLVSSGARAETVLSLFQRPWEHSDDYELALVAGVAELTS